MSFIKPIVSEKSLALAQKGQFTLRVSRELNRIEIAKQVAMMFDVKVSKITTAKIFGKRKRSRKGRSGFQSGYKKAYLTLVKGTLPGFEQTQVKDQGQGKKIQPVGSKPRRPVVRLNHAN